MASETTSLELTSMIWEELTDSLMACNWILTFDCVNLNKPLINILLIWITYLFAYIQIKNMKYDY